MKPGDVEEGAGGQRQHRGFRRVVGIGREAERVAGAEDERARQVGVEVPVGDDRALRAPSGAGGEQDRGGVVLVDQGVGQFGSWCVIAKFGEVLLEYDERDSRVAGDAFGPFGVGEQQLWRGEFEAVSDLVLGPPPVHGNGDGTERGDRPERLDPLGRVGGEDGDAVAVTDVVPLGEPRCERCRGGDVLGKGRLGPVVEHVVAGAAVAAVIRGVLEQGSQVRCTVLRRGHLNAVHDDGNGLEEAPFAREHRIDVGD